MTFAAKFWIQRNNPAEPRRLWITLLKTLPKLPANHVVAPFMRNKTKLGLKPECLTSQGMNRISANFASTD